MNYCCYHWIGSSSAVDARRRVGRNRPSHGQIPRLVESGIGPPIARPQSEHTQSTVGVMPGRVPMIIGGADSDWIGRQRRAPFPVADKQSNLVERLVRPWSNAWNPWQRMPTPRNHRRIYDASLEWSRTRVFVRMILVTAALMTCHPHPILHLTRGTRMLHCRPGKMLRYCCC